MTLDVGARRTVGDMPDAASTGAADRLGLRFSFGRDQEIASVHTRLGECRGAEGKHDVVARMRVAGCQAIGHERTPAATEARRYETDALDTDVAAMRQA